MQIINSLGQILLSESVNTQHPKFNIQHFPSGLYFLELSNANGKQTQKFIKD
ncbi:MAG: T9SS type A sorting domain-containing protein [Sphingobacteriaceae bacterium]|nr:T9SS type A sorting domain-containing protein [Sphingobacteriaceae bacterium]